MVKLTRYSRNFETEGITLQDQEKLLSSRVIVMGAGGLGSGVIMNLAALGVGQIKIIDGDIIDETNLNRQIIHKYKNIGRSKVISAKDWIQEFNPDVKVELEKVVLDDFNYFRIVQDYDIIVDCFDNYESKCMLNRIAIRHNKILIHGGVQGFNGQVTTVDPQKGGCLNCIAKEENCYLKDNIYASLSPVVNVISALQAQEVLKVITEKGTPLINKLLIYDGYEGRFRVLHYTKSFSCEVCSKMPSFEIEVQNYSPDVLNMYENK